MYAVIDFETGSVNPYKTAICSMACVLTEPYGEPKAQYYAVVSDSGRELEDAALAVNGFSREELDAGIPVYVALSTLRSLIEGHTLVAYNAKFDVAILNDRLGWNVTEAVDPIRLAYRKWPHPIKNKLSMVVERAGLPIVDAHNSLGDVLMTIQILRYLAVDNPLAWQPEKINWTWKPWEGG